MDLLPGGLAQGMSPRDFDPKQLRIGTEVELEHTPDRRIAREIAMDHLAEHSAYDRELAKMEAKLEVHRPNVDWSPVGQKVVFPLSGTDYRRNPVLDLWRVASLAGSGASAYHGYKRNVASNPIAWALWWGFWGAVIPIATVPIALAQGFAESGPGR